MFLIGYFAYVQFSMNHRDEYSVYIIILSNMFKYTICTYLHSYNVLVHRIIY